MLRRMTMTIGDRCWDGWDGCLSQPRGNPFTGLSQIACPTRPKTIPGSLEICSPHK